MSKDPGLVHISFLRCIFLFFSQLNECASCAYEGKQENDSFHELLPLMAVLFYFFLLIQVE